MGQKDEHHCNELAQQADEMSIDLEKRILTVLEELNTTHQATITKIRTENEERYTLTMKKIRDEMELKVSEKQKLLEESIMCRKQLESSILNLKKEHEKTKNLYGSLLEELEKGENEFIKKRTTIAQRRNF